MQTVGAKFKKIRTIVGAAVVATVTLLAGAATVLEYVGVHLFTEDKQARPRVDVSLPSSPPNSSAASHAVASSPVPSVPPVAASPVDPPSLAVVSRPGMSSSELDVRARKVSPVSVKRKLSLNLPVEFADGLVITFVEVMSGPASTEIGLISPAWGERKLTVRPDGEPFEITINHVRYSVLVTQFRFDAARNMFVDVEVRQLD